jgi:hypothetical protein
VTIQKNSIWIIPAVKASNLASCENWFSRS